VKYRRQYAWHKRLQLTMATVLLIAVLLFEVDIRINGWEQRAAGIPSGTGSPYFDPEHKWTSPAGVALLVHLSFAIPTLLLWTIVVIQALRKFSRPPQPGVHSRWHVRWATLGAAGMVLTALTGWMFYWLAFVATAKNTV
jgi:putative membrane protein